MNDKSSDEQNEAILKALNEAIDDPVWGQSNFLKVIGKNLVDIRNDFVAQVADESTSLTRKSEKAGQAVLKSGQKEVYVSLYSADGVNLQSWERILINLPTQMISRPIYEHEEDIRNMLKSKENKKNEAYVAINIYESDILPLPDDKAPVDKFGKKLLSLKAKTLELANISRFVHISGVYRLMHNRLVRNP